MSSRTDTPAEAKPRFPDHDGQIPPNYPGQLFQLSQDYPRTQPEPGEQPWLEIDPRTDPDAYQIAIRDYFLAGMREADFRGQDNAIRKWYQVPWMHVGSNPRESVRGLTFERRSRPGELGPTQTQWQQNWGSGFYNPVGGYVIGKVWADENNPAPNQSQFLEGTVVVKLLFSAAPDEQVPDLLGAPAWKAYIRKRHDGGPMGERVLADVRLLQMDIAVKDARAGTTGWFFGSLVYDAKRTGDPWEKLGPSGLQWGNDPTLDQKAHDGGQRVVESRMSSPQPKLATYKKELGWLGRLNGPVDNHRSSCMSCHSTAQWVSRANPVPPEQPMVVRMAWFRNLSGNTSFSPGEIPLDYSLQVALSLQNFCSSERGQARPACANAAEAMDVSSAAADPPE